MPRFAVMAGCCLLAAAVTVAGWQRGVISKTRQENERLHQESQAATEEAKDARRIPELNVREPSHELLRLRNEVRQSREQARELVRLRQENEHLASVLKALASGKAPRLAEMEGYVARETWSNAGLAAPEAALQTLFWALQEGNMERMLDCMTPELRVHFGQNLEQQDEASRRKSMREAWEPLLQIAGFRVASKEQPSENEVVLGIEAAAGGAVMKLSFRREGNEWKFGAVGPGK